MTLTPVEWLVLGAVASLAIGIITYFLKRTMNTTDNHEKDINEIKRTYVTESELKELKAELRGETGKLGKDVAEIKEHYIRRDDFYRVTADLKMEIGKVYQFLIRKEGGSSREQE